MATRRLDMSPEARKRRSVMKLRRLVKVRARFTVEDMNDGREKQTCRTCGHVVFYSHVKPGISFSPVIKKLIAYRAHNNGVSGVCPACSTKRAKERYPLPEDKP